MGITEILRRIWLFSANKIKSSESFCKQPTQLIVELIAAHNEFESEKRIELHVYKTADLIWRAFLSENLIDT